MRHSRRWRRVAAPLAGLLALSLAVTACTGGGTENDAPWVGAPQLPDETREQLRQAVTEAMASVDASGAIVGVWAPWSGGWSEGIGTVTHDSEEPVTTDMAFRAGEVTRAMTCDVLYAMDEEGLVSADDSITEYVPSVAPLSEVTLEQLCDSTSGLGMSLDTVRPMLYNTPKRVWAPRGLASYGIADRSGNPGSRFRNSDAGYLLLGLALRNVSGMSAAELIEKYVADPLGLESTFLPGPQPGPPSSGPVLPGLYTFQEARQEGCTVATDLTEISASMGYTDSGIVTDIDDLVRYGQAMAAGELTDGADRWEGALPVNPDGAAWYQYGGGAYVAGSMVGQQTRIIGYSTAVYADVQTGLTVAVVLNNSAALPHIVGYLARKLAAIASKAPPAEGENRPEGGLPWTAEHYTELIREQAVCPIE